MAQEVRMGRHQLFMEIAHVVAKRATCMRLNVGAVLVKDRSIVSIGYNGAPPGEPHCEGSTCLAGGTSCKRTIHAEDNALQRSNNFRGLDLYVTHSPCANCHTKLWNSQQVDRIFFGTPFRETDHLTDTLFDLEVYRVLPSGLVVNWQSGELADVET